MNTKRIDWTGQVEINSKTKGTSDEKVLSNKAKLLEETKGGENPKIVVAPSVAEDNEVHRSQRKESGLIISKTLPATRTVSRRIDHQAPIIRASIRKNLVQDVRRNKLC